MSNVAPCPPTLREIKYKCASCEGIHAHRFTLDYVPFRTWWLTCPLCRTYQMHRALGRILTGRFRGEAR